VPPRERAADRGTRRGRALVVELTRELRRARLERGLSQEAVATAVGLSSSEVGRIERGNISAVSLVTLTRLLSVVGLDLTARAYPTGTSLRDSGQIALIGRFRAQLPTGLRWRTEVPIGPMGDLRAWDLVIGEGPGQIGVEAETRLTDLQAVERRIALKCRDSSISNAILLLANTRTNRAAVRALQDSLRGSFPLGGAEALSRLRSGRALEGSALILI
jgi:transcriptional regulator with XRE-family HTH domain